MEAGDRRSVIGAQDESRRTEPRSRGLGGRRTEDGVSEDGATEVGVTEVGVTEDGIAL